MTQLILLRHGESIWNKKNRFTGWTDVDLTDKGIAEAHDAGKLLREAGHVFDVAFTSMLKKAIRTLWIVLDEIDLMWIPVRRSWHLNERHYGTLQGLNKAETAKKFGEKQVLLWRRSFELQPPALNKTDERHPSNDPKYKDLNEEDLPATESLKDTGERLLPYWRDVIVPEIQNGRRVIIVAHGNSLRVLVKHIEKISDEDIIHLQIPTGIPYVYELDGHLKPLSHCYLGDPERVKKATEAIKDQGKA